MRTPVLLVEDDDKISALITEGLLGAGFSVYRAATGREGLSIPLTQKISAAIVDLMLPDRDGIEVVEALKAETPELPILILSAKRNVDDRVVGLKSGADDYLVKPFAMTELAARLEALLRRSSYQSTGDTKRKIADLEVDFITREVRRGEHSIDLQPMEFDLLQFLVANAGKTVTRDMIIQKVWKYNFDPKTNIVEARICKLRDKIDRDFSPKLVHTIRGVGYVLKEE